jgi:riboflavin biosynthesis pyrimidine reductase
MACTPPRLIFAMGEPWRLATLYDRSPEAKQPGLTEPLRLLYGGDLAFPRRPDRPWVVANFVQTLDGVVSYAIRGRSGGGEISGFDAADRFVMGLLRSCADAVMVASGTLHADSGHVRIPGFIYPEARDLYRALRAQVSARRTDPLNVIVTGSGRVDLSEPTFHTPGLDTLIVTTEEGDRRLCAEHGQRLSVTRVRAVAEAGPVPPAAVIDVLQREFGVRLLLHEGGPRLLGAFLAARRIDELFLTLAPQVAGRANPPRPGLAEGAGFLPETAPWFDLQSVKHSGSHLFLRLSARP